MARLCSSSGRDYNSVNAAQGAGVGAADGDVPPALRGYNAGHQPRRAQQRCGFCTTLPTCGKTPTSAHLSLRHNCTGTVCSLTCTSFKTFLQRSRNLSVYPESP